MLNFTFHRQCETCQHIFASDRGYRHHIKANKTKPCGINASASKKREEIQIRKDRKKAISSAKIKDLGWKQNVFSKPRKRGPCLSKGAKMEIVRQYDSLLSMYHVTVRKSRKFTLSLYLSISHFFCQICESTNELTRVE